jgi:intracellular multiplication protein IcmO
MIRGVDAQNAINPNRLLRDTRPLGQRVSEFFSKPVNTSAVLLCLAASSYFFSAGALLFLFVGIICFIYAYRSHQKLPFRLPKVANAKDYNDLKPGSNEPKMAQGIDFFGNQIKGNEELWFSNEDMRTHVLIFGSTGSGKTESLVSIAYNALVQASGFIYVDGKGDNSLYAKIFSMVRSMGREDDLLLINFMTGARDIIGPQRSRLSNTMNPFCQGSSSMLTQLVVNLMGDSGQSSDGDMWKGRAIAFVEALMRLLVYMRDQGSILLDANTIRNYFPLTRLESIVIDKIFPRDDQEGVNIESVPAVVTDPLRNYLDTLPGYNKEKKGKQVSQVLEQHGFITMQLVRSFSSLADTYGHIIRTNLAEVDFKDVVLNRRILVVLLPALEKSPDELSNLGKIIVSSLKAMLASGLGDTVEGDYRDVIERKPTNAPTPFLCILDEYGYYAVKGFAVVPAQARSLGFSVIFAGQDLPAFQKASKEEAMSIGANTNIKICMKLEDPVDTWDFFNKTAGEAYVTKVDSFQTKESGFTNSYMDTKSSSSEKRSRIDLLDLKDQGMGDAHIFFRSQIIRAKMFYANPQPVKRLKVNQFLKVEPPPDSFIAKLQTQLTKFEEILNNANPGITKIEPNETINTVSNILQNSKIEDPIERNIAVLLAFGKQDEPEQAVSSLVDTTPNDELTIFTPLRKSDNMGQLFTQDVAAFSLPLLDLNETYSSISAIERLTGESSGQATTIANELIKDLQERTKYPPDQLEHVNVDNITAIVQSLCNKFSMARSELPQQ